MPAILSGPLGRLSPEEADIAQHEARFERYTASYLSGPHSPMLDLKHKHSKEVLRHAQAIVRSEGLAGDMGRAALLAALYHDTGRFPQFTRWQTFSDAVSVNHGYLGVGVLKREKMLAGESVLISHMVLTAVALHNRYQVPQGPPEAFRTVTHVVRDADKLDIMRIMAERMNEVEPSEEVVLKVRNEADKWNPDIVKTILAGAVPSYTDLKYVNDFRLLLGAWLADLHFPSARIRLACSGHVEAVLSGLPDAPELRPALAYLKALLEKAKDGGPVSA